MLELVLKIEIATPATPLAIAKLRRIIAEKLNRLAIASMPIELRPRSCRPDPPADVTMRHTVPIVPSVSMKKRPVF